MNSRVHLPVMVQEVTAALLLRDGGQYVDATFGRGGYSRAFLTAAKVNVLGIDRDPAALEAGTDLVKEFKPRLHLVQGPFGALDILVLGEQLKVVDGVAFDLGVSSPQLDEADRGFSFMLDGPLDMRMSQSGPSAADAVNKLEERELADIIYTLGEERFSRRVAKTIVEQRASRPILRTHELASLVRAVVPRSADGIDPATRTFQALRLYVNDELGELERGLSAAESVLKPEGRLVVVSFHSLEDRIVKNFLRRRSGTAPNASRHAPANDVIQRAPSFRLLSSKPQTPSPQEIEKNPRARSAKLRVAERTDAPSFERETAA